MTKKICLFCSGEHDPQPRECKVKGMLMSMLVQHCKDMGVKDNPMYVALKMVETGEYPLHDKAREIMDGNPDPEKDQMIINLSYKEAVC